MQRLSFKKIGINAIVTCFHEIIIQRVGTKWVIVSTLAQENRMETDM